jgi:hypothetical protein
VLESRIRRYLSASDREQIFVFTPKAWVAVEASHRRQQQSPQALRAKRTTISVSPPFQYKAAADKPL